ncbi:MAG TPA: hypothetical protein ENK55_10180 [Actinobacteria bacterium]|nr:hypothetical protein [Actinomycetota bacterium]
MAGAWTAAITLVGLGAAVVPTTPYWLAGFVLAGGYAALAVTVVWRLVGLDRREVETVRRRFEEIVAPLRNEMPR